MEYPHTADMQPQKPKSLLKEKKKKSLDICEVLLK